MSNARRTFLGQGGGVVYDPVTHSSLSSYETKQAHFCGRRDLQGLNKKKRVLPTPEAQTHRHTHIHCPCLISSQKAESCTLLSNKEPLTTICNLFLSLSVYRPKCLFTSSSLSVFLSLYRALLFFPFQTLILSLSVSPLFSVSDPLLCHASPFRHKCVYLNGSTYGTSV